MYRRTFNKIVGLGTMSLAISEPPRPRQLQQESRTSLPPSWPNQTYRRLLVDTHVPDWDPRLLGSFNPAEYVSNIARGGFQSLMQYANSHVGLCLWRTRVGQMHASMGGRDFFGEVVSECRRHGMHTVAYFSVIFDNWNYEHHPDWRIMSVEGNNKQLQSRYGVVCPNSPYGEYPLACIQEIVGNYDIAGIFFDMTFWPDVCYCAHCTKRYRQEYDTEPPRTVNWDDPNWRTFQKARQRWLLEFARTLTKKVKKVRPITVNHQFSTIFDIWPSAVPLEMSEVCDYVGGDFYGGPAQLSLVCKAYTGLTRNRPFEFHISRTVNLSDHVTVKPIDELRIESSVATLHSAALLFIDAINVDGNLNPAIYDLFATLNTERAIWEPFLGGELLADVALYYDKDSMYNPSQQGVHIAELLDPGGEISAPLGTIPHREALVGAARILREAHVPFGVVTHANLEQLTKYRAVVLPNVLELTADQAGRFRQFVEQGGVLYASGPSSLSRLHTGGPRFLLGDVLGAQYKGTIGTNFTYLTPKDGDLKKAIWPQDHMSFAGPMIQVEALPGTEVLATVTLPFVAPELGRCIGSRFGAIHSNPPALTPGTDPGAMVNSFGRGRAVWVAASFESRPAAVNSTLVLWLLQRELPRPFWFEVDAHPAVEMTLFHQLDKSRLLAGLLNMQQELPSIPLGATVRVRLPSGRRPTKVVRAPERQPIPFEKVGQYVQFRVEPFGVLAMMLVEYE